MSGTRFARTGRGRLIVCFGIAILVFGMIAIFHSSQQQLDESRQALLLCEQQKEALKEELEKRNSIEKNHKHQRQEQMEAQQNLENDLKDLTDQLAKQKMEANMKYDKLEQTHKLLQTTHDAWVKECDQSKKQLLEDANDYEKKLQSLRSQLQQEQTLKDKEIAVWKEKHDKLERELQSISKPKDGFQAHLQLRVTDLEHTVEEYRQHCDYKPMARNTSATTTKTHSLNKPNSNNNDNIVKSFSQQESVSPGLYHINIRRTNSTNKQLMGNKGGGGDGLGVEPYKPLPFSERNNHSLIINSVENFQMVPKPIPSAIRADNLPSPSMGDKLTASPLSAPRKPTPTEGGEASSKAENYVLEPNNNDELLGKQSGNGNVTLTSKGLQPQSLEKPMQPNQRVQRKLPDNVAPIPANFDDFENKPERSQGVMGSLADALTPKAMADGNNNRYSNVISDMKTEDKVGNGDTAGGKDLSKGQKENDDAADAGQDFLNNQNLELANDEANYFDSPQIGLNGKSKNANADSAKDKKQNDDDDDDGGSMMGAGAGVGMDIAVKAPKHLLDTDNLRNEVAADQGKEFPADGLPLDYHNEEDGDDDYYSNLAARQQGEQAIRN